MSLEQTISEFLELYCPDGGPLLLALSGGPDSMALFHILLAEGYPFEVAHVDHGWRVESGEESLILGQKCREAGVCFHMTRLGSPEAKNLEDRARKARLAFFKEVIGQRNLRGVLLAHHADDHAETVLKRLFEGASLPKLKGLLPQIELEGITLFRPFLKIRKKEIIKWLEDKNIDYFFDRTNTDSKFLRTRLRQEIMPTLAGHFGKEITSNLCRLGEAAAELEGFLEELTAPYLQRVERNEESYSLYFEEFPHSDFVTKAVLRSFFEREGVTISVSVLEAILGHLKKGSCHKSLYVGKQQILIHRKQLRVCSQITLNLKKKCLYKLLDEE